MGLMISVFDLKILSAIMLLFSTILFSTEDEQFSHNNKT